MIAKAGHKCVQLGDLLSSGFHVPKGFCILATGYELFITENGLERNIQARIEKVTSRADSLCPGEEAELVEGFVAARFPDALKQEILAAYRSLATNGHRHPSVAVRSSGSLEDGIQSSFAGQFESYLNVRGEKQLLDQIRRCWASFWNTRSLCYQMDRCGHNGSAGIAILVQEMIPARLSGVLFSANPVSGSDRQMVIEASWGLGQAIVDGTVKPDRYVVDFQTRRILEQTVQNKENMLVLDPRKGGVTRRVRVPAVRQRIPCLTRREIDLLVLTGRKVHEHFGRPQDIEWAFHNHELYLLQARPITTLSRAGLAAGETRDRKEIIWHSEFDTVTTPQTEWVSTTIRDMLPGALSPLTISHLSALEYGFQKPQEQLGLLPLPSGSPTQSFLGFFYNRAHLNMSLIRSLVRQVPLVSPENLERLLREDDGSPKRKSWLSLGFARDVPNLLRVGLHALETGRRLSPAAEALLSQGLRQYELEAPKCLEPAAPEELLCRMDEIQKRRAEIYAMHITASEFGEVTFQLFKQLTGRLAGDEQGRRALQMITGSSAPLFAKPIIELWSLAQRIPGSRTLQHCLSLSSVQAAWRRLQSEKGRPARDFKEAFHSFLQRYGYRSRYGAELMHPSWEEEPVFILSMVKIYSRLLLTLNPWEMEREQAQRRRHNLQSLEANLNPVSKRVLHELLKLMDILVPMRQNMRALSLMQAHLARRVMQQLGRHLHGRRLLQSPQDIFFLTMEEVRQCTAESSNKPASPASAVELQSRVERRKAEYRKNRDVVLPERFRGTPEPVRPADRPQSSQGDHRLRGIPVSTGRVTGPARRITAPVQDIRVQAGEILILPGMDPGWTPLFPAASAIVTERGGVLSHGSILTRTYGIPAVTGISDVTRIIQTGQVVTVDGDRGEVWI